MFKGGHNFCCSSGKCSSMPPDRKGREAVFKGGNNFETILSQPCYSHMPPDGKGELGGVQRWTQLNKQTSSRNRVNTAGTVRS